MSEIKKKRISKKNKAAWRKTDIKDVEEYLEEQRQEERVGSYTEKKDEDLFTIDTNPKVPAKRAGLTPKNRRKLNAKKPMRSWDALENRSKVQDPIAKRNHVKQKKNGRNIEEEVRNPTRPRHFKANSDRERYYKELEERQAKPKNDPKKTARDIWVEEDFRDKLPGLKDEKGWVSKDLARHVADNLGPKVVKVHDSIRHRTTKAKKFIPPHPGISYNPSLKDHRNLIDAVVNREEKIIKEEKHLKRVTTEMFSKVTPEERDRRRMEEMSMGLDDDELNSDKKSFMNNTSEGEKSDTKSKTTKKGKMIEEETKENEQEEEPYRCINPPVENKKKSKQARNKALKQKELLKKHAEKKALKKQIADINRIKSLKSEVAQEEEELNELKKRRKKAAFKRKFEPKRLSSTKFQEPDADLTMPEDMAGNLRNVKVESSLLVDRFKNFQKRNILPASVKAPRQKPKKIKRFLRSSHKDPGVSHDMLRAQKNLQQQLQKATIQE